MKRALLAGLILLLPGRLVSAAFIDAGNWTIPQAAGQTVTVVVYTTSAETTLALNFYTSLVNGPDNSLRFTALDFDVTDATYGNYMFYDGVPTASPYFENAWSGSATQAAGGAGAFDPPLGAGPNPIPGTQASPAGLVRVTLDASSATTGTWDFLLTTPVPPSPPVATTNWTNGATGTAGPPTLLAGTITVVPEPAILVYLLGLVGTGGVGFWFHRRRRRAG